MRPLAILLLLAAPASAHQVVMPDGHAVDYSGLPTRGIVP